MNKEEIIKSLRVCGTPGTVRCQVCPYYPIYGLGHCAEHAMNDAADLIEAQAAEIEKLKAQEVKNVALQFQLTHLKKLRQHDDEQYVVTESVGNVMLMGFYKGRIQIEEQVIDWLERMVRNG